LPSSDQNFKHRALTVPSKSRGKFTYTSCGKVTDNLLPVGPLKQKPQKGVSPSERLESQPQENIRFRELKEFC